MATQRAQLSVGQIGLGTLDVATVPKPHELDIWVDPRGGADRCDAVVEVITGPWEPHFPNAIRSVTRDD
jgi:hypothetical protein